MVCWVRILASVVLCWCVREPGNEATPDPFPAFQGGPGNETSAHACVCVCIDFCVHILCVHWCVSMVHIVVIATS